MDVLERPPDRTSESGLPSIVGVRMSGYIKLAVPRIEWVDYRCRAECIRPAAIIDIGDKEVTMTRVMLAPLPGLSCLIICTG